MTPHMRNWLKNNYKHAMRPLVQSETEKISVDLKKALSLVGDMSQITCMDQALSVYLQLMRLRATTDIKVLLNEKVTRTNSVLPFQVRLFRS